MIKILIIRFSSIGDIVLTTPIVRCLKQQMHDVEIHYLTKSPFRGILEHNPHISKIHTIDKNVSEVISQLKSENFNYIIDLHHNLRSTLVKLQLQKPSFTFNKLNFEKWLIVNFKINRLPKVHIVDRYMQTLIKLSITNDNKGLDYFIPAKDEIDLNQLPPAFCGGYTALVIGAKHFTKQLPQEKIISICKNVPGPIIVLGGKEDTARGEAISAALGEKIFNACGKYNLNQSASFIRQARKVISHDTGLMHIAAAFRKEIISVWGNTIPEFGMYPYMPHTNSKIMEVKGLNCRPCSKIGYPQCPKGHFKCMNTIDENTVIPDNNEKH